MTYLTLLLLVATEAPSIGAGVGVGTMYVQVPCLAANITGELPVLENTSLQLAARVQTFPLPILGGPTPLGLWRLNASVGGVQSLTFGRAALGIGGAAVAGAATIEFSPQPWAPEVGIGVIAQLRFAIRRGLSLRLRFFAPLVATLRPSGAFYAAHPELTLGASWDFYEVNESAEGTPRP